MKLGEFIDSLINMREITIIDGDPQIEFMYNGKKLEATNIRTESVCDYSVERGDLSIHPGYKTTLTVELDAT